MALNPVPWAIDGGKVSAADARRVAYAATSGATGITLANDFRVVASTPTGASVLVYAGSGVINTLYPLSSKTQSYIVSADTSTTVNVAATSGSARTDYLIIKVTDPQYGGAAPADLVNGPYVTFALVPSITNLAYPFLPLARIVQPANNGAITQAMITPLRSMSNPRRQRDLNTLNLSAAETQTYTGVGGEQWPNAAAWTVAVPAWATQVRIRADWAQVLVPAGNAVGNLWVQMGANGVTGVTSTKQVGYNTPGSTGAARSTFVCADTLWVPAVMRGTAVYMNMRAKLTSASANSARLVADTWSSMVLDLEWLEAPTEDDA